MTKISAGRAEKGLEHLGRREKGRETDKAFVVLAGIVWEGERGPDGELEKSKWI